jgi:CshA-type fibril repeat protein
VSYSVSSVAVSTSVVQLTLGSAVEAGRTVTVSYVAPTPDSWRTNLAVQDTAGNDAVSLSSQAVTNNSTAGPDIAPPTLSSVNASGTTVTLQFNETLKSTPTSSLPSLSAFTVFVGETPMVPTAISISGSSVSLTLPSSVPSGTEVRVSYLAPASSSANTNAAIQDVIGNDALSFSGTTRPTSTTWNWVETFDAATMSTNSSNCPGGGSINRSKQTLLPNGITYTVGVTGSYLCIHDATESLSERGGAAGMFVATGLVTEPGLKLTTSNEGCLANEICAGRGRLFLTFSQPVINPVFSFAGWGGSASGVSWSEMRVLTPGVTMSKLSGTNILVSGDGTYVEDNGQSSSTRCSASTSGSSAVCGSLQLNGTITTVEFELFQQTYGGTGNEDTWNLTASMAEDFGLVPTTYESSGVASHGVGSLKLGATVEADQASALYANTNADAVPRWTSLATNAKKDDGVAAWVNSPTINFGSAGSTYSTTVALAGVERTANLCGWIDFNRDEFFAYSERTCATDPTVGATTATLTWTVPANVGAGITYARVRLSYDTITDATGKLGTGEVEDYSMLLPSSSLPSGVNDASTNGQDINQTISPLTNDQFETGYPGNNSTLKLCGSGQTPNTCSVTTLVIDGQGTYTVNADGTVTFNPLPNFTGTATPVTYQITDTQATPLTTSATITPTVVPRPTATADTSIDLLNITQTKNPLTNDTAGSSDAPLSASSVRLCGSSQTAPSCNATSVTVSGGVYSVSQTTGVITFVPTNNFTGTATPVTYQVSDSLNQVASSTYTPTVVATPTASNDVSSGAWNVNQTISPFSNDTNASGYPLGSLALCGTSPAESPNSCSQPVLTTADGTYTVNTNGTVTFDPLPTFSGTATQPVRYQAVDGLGQYVNATITPYVTPPAPPTAVADTSSNLVNVTQTKNVLTNDTTIDPLITLDATSVRLCGSSQVSPNCIETSVTVTGGTYSVNTTTGIVSFAPTSNWTGTAAPVTYQVTSSTNQKVSSTYTPTVVGATNDTSSGSWNVNQTISPFSNDSAVTGHPFGSLKLCGADETPNSCTVTTLVVDGEGTYTVNANGTVTFDPLPSFSGTATSIRYQAVDDLGQYVNATITPSVTAPAPPTAVADTSANLLNVVQTMNVLANDTTIDPLITLTASSVRLCAVGESSPTCTATSVPVTGGTYSVNTTTGLVSFTPTTDVSGTAPSVTYQVTSSTNQTVSSTYTATVYPKPVGVNEAISGAYDTNQVYSPLTNDGFSSVAPVVLSTFKLCGSSQTPNSCSETTVTIANQGTYTINPDGTVTFNPLPSFSGVATPVQYQAADTLGQYVNATISPTVAAPTAPVASDETKSVLRGNSVSFTTITGTSGLATGTQLQTSGASATCLITPGSNPAACESDNVVTIAGEGTFTLNPTTGVVTYAADANATAGTKASITYRVTDAVGQTDTGVLTPVIAPPPVAANDTSTGNWDTNQAIPVLSNDDPGAVSAPLVPSTVKLCGDGQSPNGCNVTTLVVLNQGTYTVQPDGNVLFDPLPTFTGTATAVRYQVQDSLGQVATATITPTVRVAPNAVNDVSSENYDTNHVIDPLDNDVNGTGTIDPTTVKLCGVGQTAPTCTQTTLTVSGVGTYTVDAATGVVTFDPLPTFTGTAPAVTYQVSDSFGQTDSATITPTVGPPPLPVAVNDALTSNWDTNQTYTPTSNDTVGSSFPLLATTVKLCNTNQSVPTCSATTLTVANEGTYTVTANGTVTFDPLPTFRGTATAVTYQATDSLGRSDDATITPTVTPPPAPAATPETKPVIPGGTATFTTITGTSGLATGTQLQTSGANATCLITPGSSPAACEGDNSVTITGEGTFTLNPTTGIVTFVADANATAGTKTALTYRVTDVTGQTATSTLTPVIPQPPVASPDTNTGDWDTNQTISILTNDTAGDVTAPLVATTVKLCGVAPSAQTPNNCTQTSLTIANQGTYTVNANGTVTFDPLPTFNGTATAVRYQVADTLGQVANTTITPTVRAPRAPIPTPDINTGNWDTNQTISPLANDTPGEPTAPLDATTVKLCGVAPNAQTPNNCTQTSLTITNQGTYTVNANGTVTFDPLPSFTGTATAVKYQVTDVIGQTVNTTITPTVLAPPAPVASPGTVSLIAGGTEEFDPIFGTGALAAKATGGPDLTNSTVCIVDPATTVCGTTSVTIAGEGTFTLDTTTGIVTYTALSTATSGTKTAISYKITDALNVTVTSTLTPSIIPKPTARPDTSIGVMEKMQTLSPVGNDSPGATTYPLSATTVLLCGATETAPGCTKTTVTVVGEGTYVVKANGTVQFTPESSYFGTATPMPYSVRDSLGQVAHSTLNPKVVPPPAPITELDTGTAEQGSSVVLSPWSNDNGGVVPSGVTGTVELVPNSIRLCGPTDTAPNCTRTSLTTDDGTYTVDTTTGKVTFVHRTGFLGTVTQPVTYQIANDWTGLSGIGITTNILIPTIIPPAPPAPAPTPTPAPAPAPVPVLEDPHAVVDVSTGAWDTNQIISIFTNDVFPGSEASLVSIKLCATLEGQMATGSVSQGCAETTLTISGEGTYTVNADGTVTFDPLPSFRGTATPIRYQAVDALGRFVNSTITPTVEAPPVVITVSNELPATGENLLAEITAFLLLAGCGVGLRRRFRNA